MQVNLDDIARTQVPGLNRILMPTAWLACWTAFTPILVGLLQSQGMAPPGYALELILLLAVLGIVVWIVLIRSLRSEQRFLRPMRLALFAHLVFAGYISALAITVATLSVSLDSNATVSDRWLPLLIAPIVVAIIWASRRGERLIIRACMVAAFTPRYPAALQP